jgi:hypothetical protein
MLTYRFNRYYEPADNPPLNSKYFLFLEDINIEEVREQLNINKYALFRFNYTDEITVYYIIISDTIDIDMTLLKILKNEYDRTDHHCDYYIKPILSKLITDGNL